ncbi:MAG: class I SAM-dependent methyltransferase [Cyanobacteriota bacterium]
MESLVRREISAKTLIKLYDRAGIDVRPFFVGVDTLCLREDASGLLQWWPSVAGDSDFYAKLSSQIRHYYPPDKPEFLVALPLISQEDLVLEVGCGQGRFGQYLSADNWFGVDINAEAIRVATSKGMNCRVWNFLEDDLALLPVQQFPVICSFQMIEHLPEPGRFFEFASGALAPSGRLIVGAPAIDSLLGKDPMSMLNLPPHHQTWWTDKALRLFPERYGFTCEDIIHAPLDEAHHRGFVSLLIKDLLVKRIASWPSWLSRSITSASSKPISAVTKLLVRDGSIDPVFGARGQSVVAIYRKTSRPLEDSSVERLGM